MFLHTILSQKFSGIYFSNVYTFYKLSNYHLEHCRGYILLLIHTSISISRVHILVRICS